MEQPDRIGPYLVQGVLGEGAMGRVYLALHPRLGREVAIKLLHERDPDLLARFGREAEVMARIRDERVVEVYEAGVHEGEPYLVLEFCAGRDLAVILRERGALPPEEAAMLVAGIARGVAAAHAAGVIHRDLKPANVLVGPDGRPKVTDFGIAAARSGRRQSLTESGVILGTPAYMAPEQARDSRSADARSDVYALGAILYECLAGRPPFVGATSLAILSKVMEGQPEPLPATVPEALAEVVTCALSRDPGDRFAQALFLAEALEEALAVAAVGPRTGALLWPVATVVGGLLLVAGVAASLGTPRLPGTPTPTQTIALTGTALRATPTAAARASAAPSPSASVPGSPSPGLSPLSPSGEVGLPRCRTREHFLAKQRFLHAELSELRAAAEGGDPAAMTELARRYSEGRGVPVDVRASTVWLEGAAQAGDPEGMANLAHYYNLRLASPADPQARARWLDRAAALGGYAALLVRSNDLPPEERRAARRAAWRIAGGDAERGDPTAINALLQDSWVRGDLGGVKRWLGPALAIGLRAARLLQGYLLRYDNTEPARFAELFRLASEQGNVEATCAWARCLLEGTGVARDPSRGESLLRGLKVRDPRGLRLERVRLLHSGGRLVEWWREVEALLLLKPSSFLAHRWGDLALHVMEVVPELERDRRQRGLDLSGRFLTRAKALRSFDGRIPYNLGVFIAEQKGPTERAKALLGRAARLGHTDGAYSYGNVLLREGREIEEGLRWLQWAGEQGSAKGWRHLAALSYQGLYGPVDEEKALNYLLLAAELGELEGIETLSARFIQLGRYADAAPWAERARSLGSVAGAIDLALIRVMCGPTSADAEAGLAELESLADSEARANVALETMYRLGMGVRRDEAEARRYGRRALELQSKEP